LPLALKTLVELLAQTEPVTDNTDVAWNGPYYLAGRRRWASTYFSLYQKTLYASMQLGADRYAFKWPLGAATVEFDRDYRQGEFSNNEALWTKVLGQINPRLRGALREPAAYNRRVARHLPLECRKGEVRRALTWPKEAKPPVPQKTLVKLERALANASSHRRLRSMTAEHYFLAAQVAYDAAFPDLRGSGREKYRMKADGRDGGLLALPARDSAAFRTWFHSRAWAGKHPWEILFGHPHGVMLSPKEHADSRGGWSFLLSVHSGAWYSTAVKMALALAAQGVSFDFLDHAAVLAALRGEDLIEVGPTSQMLCLEELRALRPDALRQVTWEPIPLIVPITEEQRARVALALED